ncbi:MAG TPA: NAD(P)/FAD-dependent oxidoreductase [Candidatus Dormibacteraeota bacterium]|nr:NAD(P)/FAD-dependent oxidoreductase [Candidatus Dormibacteraeota bacterium]
MVANLDAVVVGSGPNGLAAAITLAERGLSVHVVEAESEIGGGCRTAELTLPGFHHDYCAAVLAFAEASPFFRAFDPAARGVGFVFPPAPLAHPLENDEAVLLERSVDDTAANLGGDGARYRRIFAPLASHAPQLLEQFLGPLRFPRHPLVVGGFGIPALLPATAFARIAYRERRARALFAGVAGHSMLSLDSPASTSMGLMLSLVGHAAGWPVVRGGTANVVSALADRLVSLGGTIETGRRVRALADLPGSRLRLLDLVPRDVERVCGDELPDRYRSRLRRYRYGPGVFKVDWALDGPVPWSDPRCARAGTVHVGGGLEEIVASEAAVAAGRHSERPLVILAQPSLFDATRAPAGRQTLWGYCHVPNGSRRDMTGAIEAQVERFAPGFRDRIIARNTMDSAALEAHNANNVGGDINGGLFSLGQLFTRPAPRISPYTTPNRSIFICSASTPPGGGVHGMCGWWAAQAALRSVGRG